MNSPRSITWAILGLGVAAVFLAMTAKDVLPPEPVEQELIRLAELALQPEAKFQETRDSDSSAGSRPVWRQLFPRALNDWTLLPDRNAGAAQMRRLEDLNQKPDARFARLDGETRVLVTLIPAQPQQMLELRYRARVTDSSPSEHAGSHLVVVPLKRSFSLPEFLQTKTLADLENDPKKELLCYGKEVPFFSTALEPSEDFVQGALDFRVPLDANALLIEVSCGAAGLGSHVDVAEMSLFPRPLRQRLEQQETVPELTLLAPESFSLRRIDCLSERRDGFLLAPPSRVSLECRLPQGPVVLEFGRARIHERRPDWREQPQTLSVSVENLDDPGGGPSVVHEEELNDQLPTGWIDRQVDLSFWAGKRVRLSFEGDAKRGSDLLAVGAPLIRRRTSTDPGWNVVLVSLDTVRLDHLSHEGYSRPTTPFLAELAQQGLWFRHAVSTSSYTLPSHASLFTGQLPSHHGAINQRAGHNRISTTRSDPLGRRLADAGYLTAGFTGGAYLGPGFGFADGFDRYSTMDPLLPDHAPSFERQPLARQREFNVAHRATRRWEGVLDWLRHHQDSRFFLFVHTYHVHEFLPTAENSERFHRSNSGSTEQYLRWLRDKRKDATQIAPADLQAGIDAYDATLRDADEAVRQLVDCLKDLGLWNRTVLVLTSDHGEEFLDHGRLGHGRTLYEEMLRVPMIWHVPGIPAQEFPSLVSLVDVTPSLEEMLGLAPRVPRDGESLWQQLNGAAWEPTLAFSELELDPRNQWRAASSGDYKLVEFHDQEASPAPELSLFQVRNDPQERENLADREAERTIGMRREMTQRLEDAKVQRQRVQDAQQEVSEEDLQKLEALGYMGDE